MDLNQGLLCGGLLSPPPPLFYAEPTRIVRLALMAERHEDGPPSRQTVLRIAYTWLIREAPVLRLPKSTAGNGERLQRLFAQANQREPASKFRGWLGQDDATPGVLRIR